MPSPPSNATFVAAIQAMTVAGVNKHFDYPPQSIVAADLPVAFPLMPSGILGERVMSCIDGNKTRAIGYVICVEAVGLDVQSLNYGKLAELMDNLETALDALTIANFIDYEISATAGYAVAGNTYWAIVAEIRGRSV